jgi:hypothetical protein
MKIFGIYNGSRDFILGHDYQIDVIAEIYDAHDKHEYFVTTLEKNSYRAKMGLVPLSATPHKHIVCEGRTHGSAKDFIKFKRNKLMKQGER